MLLQRQLCETVSFLTSVWDADLASMTRQHLWNRGYLTWWDIRQAHTHALWTVAFLCHTLWHGGELKDDRLHAYHVKRTQEQTVEDYTCSVVFARWIFSRSAVQDFRAKIFFTGKYTFLRDGAFKIYNQPYAVACQFKCAPVTLLKQFSDMNHRRRSNRTIYSTGTP